MNMPKNGEDWPLVTDMVANNQRLLVFTSIRSKEQSEGIAYQWNYMVENQCKNLYLSPLHHRVIFLMHILSSRDGTNQEFNSREFAKECLKFADGDGGMQGGKCPNRAESSPLNDKTKPLVLVNHFSSIPFKITACEHNSADLINMLHTCFGSAGNRWANFVAVDFYKVPSNFISYLIHSILLGGAYFIFGFFILVI